MVKNNAQQLEAWDKKYLWHPFTQHYLWEKEPTLIINKAKGPFLFDHRGKKYLDGVSSLWVNLHGHNHPVLNRAIKSQLSRMAHTTFLGLSHEPAIRLAKDLVQITPRPLKRVFYSDSGATAIEIALKMAYQYWIERDGPGNNKTRREFLALKGSYHGDTIGAVSVGGIGSFHSKFKPLLFKTHFAMSPDCIRCPFNKKKVSHRFRNGESIKHTPKPGDARKETGCRWECLKDVERLMKRKKNKLAGAIVEPIVQGAAGMLVQPEGYVRGFDRLCKKHGVLFIADEVATGFCRTSSFFAIQQENVSPDILCLAKALTGGYSPLAVTMTTAKIFKSFWGPPEKMKTFFHGHSYTGHPLGAAVARANLRLIKSTKLLEKTRQKAHLIRTHIEGFLPHPRILSVRQAGLMVGIDLQPSSTESRLGVKICKRLLNFGIWLRPLGNTIVLMPPPITSDKELIHLVRSLLVVLNEEEDS